MGAVCAGANQAVAAAADAADRAVEATHTTGERDAVHARTLVGTLQGATVTTAHAAAIGDEAKSVPPPAAQPPAAEPEPIKADEPEAEAELEAEVASAAVAGVAARQARAAATHVLRVGRGPADELRCAAREQQRPRARPSPRARGRSSARRRSPRRTRRRTSARPTSSRRVEGCLRRTAACAVMLRGQRATHAPHCAAEHWAGAALRGARRAHWTCDEHRRPQCARETATHAQSPRLRVACVSIGLQFCAAQPRGANLRTRWHVT